MKNQRDLPKETYEDFNDKLEPNKEINLLISSLVPFPFQHATSKIYLKRAQMQKRKLRIRLMVD